MGRIKSVGLVLARALVILVVEAVSLLFLAWLLPGVSLNGWRAAAASVVLLALLNAVLRPLVLLVAVNLGIIVFTLIAFLLNAVVVLLASSGCPASAWTAGGRPSSSPSGWPGLNGLLTGLLSLNDEDSLYRNVTRRLARRRVEGAGEGARHGRGADRRAGRGGAAGGAGGGAHAHAGALAGRGHPPPRGLGVRRAVDDQRGAGRAVLRQQRQHPRLSLVRQGHRAGCSSPTTPRTPGPSTSAGRRGRPVRGPSSRTG